LNIPKILLFALLAALSLSIAACGSESEPEHRTLNLEVSEGVINLSGEELRVTQGDTVTMSVASDEHGLFHLHGYDHKIPVGPGEAAEITFDATATGRFNFTFHPGEGEHSEGGEMNHGMLFESETLENGQSFAFTITNDLAGTEIVYHNHMNHEQTGSIMASRTSGGSGDVSIEVQTDGAFSPPQVTASVGSSVVWTNAVDERQRIVSGHPPENPDEENEHEEGGGEEVDLGALEVHPR
jgi:plastocyanin